MNTKLQLLFDTLEQDRLDVLKKVSSLTPERFMSAPGHGKWSVSQILTHIMISEKLSLGYMKKKSLGIDQLQDSGLVESVKMIVLKISQRLPLKFKAPKIVLERTPEALSLDELAKEWSHLREELKVFLESIAEKNRKKKIYKHPIAGMLDVTQAITFFHEHVHHHWPQVKRLL